MAISLSVVILETVHGSDGGSSQHGTMAGSKGRAMAAQVHDILAAAKLRGMLAVGQRLPGPEEHAGGRR